MMVEVTNEILNYISIVLITIVPIGLIYYNRYLDKKRSAKEEKIAFALKEDTDEMANELRLANANIAVGIKEKLETSETFIRDRLEKTNNEIKEKLEQSQVDILQKLDASVEHLNARIDDLSNKQIESGKQHTSLISELQSRANANMDEVDNIKKDILEIADVVDEAVTVSEPVKVKKKPVRKLQTVKRRQMKRRS